MIEDVYIDFLRDEEKYEQLLSFLKSEGKMYGNLKHYLEGRSRNEVLEELGPFIRDLKDNRFLSKYNERIPNFDKYVLASNFISVCKLILKREIGIRTREPDSPLPREILRYTNKTIINGKEYYIINEKKLGNGDREDTRLFLKKGKEDTLLIGFIFSGVTWVLKVIPLSILFGKPDVFYREFLKHIITKYGFYPTVLDRIYNKLREKGFERVKLHFSKFKGSYKSFKIELDIKPYPRYIVVHYDVQPMEHISGYRRIIVPLEDFDRGIENTLDYIKDVIKNYIKKRDILDKYLKIKTIRSLMKRLNIPLLPVGSKPRTSIIVDKNGIFVNGVNIFDILRKYKLSPYEQTSIVQTIFENILLDPDDETQKHVEVKALPMEYIDTLFIGSDEGEFKMLKYLRGEDPIMSRYYLFKLRSAIIRRPELVKGIDKATKKEIIGEIMGNPLYIIPFDVIARSLYDIPWSEELNSVFLFYLNPDNPQGDKIFLIEIGRGKYIPVKAKSYVEVGKIIKKYGTDKIIKQARLFSILVNLPHITIPGVYEGPIITKDLFRREVNREIQGERRVNRVHT